MRRTVLALLLAFSALARPVAAQDLVGHGGPVRALATLPGGRVVSGGFDQAVILWEGATGRALRVARWHAGAVHALVARPDGGFASAGEDGRVALWAAGPGEAPERVLEGHAGPVAALATGPGGALASAGWDGTARIWDPAAGTARVLEGHAGQVTAAAFLPDGRLATAGYDGTLRLWGADGAPVTLAEFGLPLNALAALPDGVLAAAGADGTVRLVDPGGAAPVRELPADPRPVATLAVSPDGGTLAVGALGGGVTLWALPEGRVRHRLDGPGLPVWSAAFAPDGTALYTGGADRRVRRWDPATGLPLAVPGPDAVPGPGEDRLAAAAAAHPQGARVFRACGACHAVAPTATPMAGPHLGGLFGRTMGTVPGYAYSDRLARGDIRWDRGSVADLFTRGPDVVTPGTRMPVQRVGEAADMAALLDFLEAATAPMPPG